MKINDVASSEEMARLRAELDALRESVKTEKDQEVLRDLLEALFTVRDEIRNKLDEQHRAIDEKIGTYERVTGERLDGVFDELKRVHDTTYEIEDEEDDEDAAPEGVVMIETPPVTPDDPDDEQPPVTDDDDGLSPNRGFFSL